VTRVQAGFIRRRSVAGGFIAWRTGGGWVSIRPVITRPVIQPLGDESPGYETAPHEWGWKAWISIYLNRGFAHAHLVGLRCDLVKRDARASRIHPAAFVSRGIHPWRTGGGWVSIRPVIHPPGDSSPGCETAPHDWGLKA
jgi:hypothetical protein